MSTTFRNCPWKALWPEKYQSPPPQRTTPPPHPPRDHGLFTRILWEELGQSLLLVSSFSELELLKPQLPAQHLSCVLGLWNYERNLFWIILSNLSCVFGEKKNLSSSPVPYGTDNICQPRCPKLESLLPLRTMGGQERNVRLIFRKPDSSLG